MLLFKKGDAKYTKNSSLLTCFGSNSDKIYSGNKNIVIILITIRNIVIVIMIMVLMRFETKTWKKWKILIYLVSPYLNNGKCSLNCLRNVDVILNFVI